MKEQEIIVNNIDELIALIENTPDDMVIEIDLGGEDEHNDDSKNV